MFLIIFVVNLWFLSSLVSLLAKMFTVRRRCRPCVKGPVLRGSETSTARPLVVLYFEVFRRKLNLHQLF